MGRQVREEAWKLCEFYGEMIIPFLLSALVGEDTKAFRSLLMGFLKQFGETTVPYALKGLNDTRWFVKRNMLSLLAGCKSKEIIPHIKPYCRDENEKVRWDALKCLLNLQDAYGLETLRHYLESGSREDLEQAITLLGIFRVKDGMSDLIKLYRGEGPVRADLALRLLIIQSLGTMGDPRCLDMFRDILSAKSLFFKKDVEKMKEEVYKTLKNFPYKEIEDIVREGVESRNKVISEESLRLSKMGGK
jgi:HEAT repeat protein